jgi:hypothetical protein
MVMIGSEHEGICGREIDSVRMTMLMAVSMMKGDSASNGRFQVNGAKDCDHH